jgi:excisionase family DNA binding protein
VSGAPVRPLVPVPTLDALAADPAVFLALPSEAQAALYAQVSRLEAVLRAVLLTRPAAPSAPPVSDPLRWLTPADVAARLGFKSGYVLELCRTGAIPSVKLGKYRRIAAPALAEWQKKALDTRGSDSLPSAHASGPGPPRAPSPRAHAVTIRRAARRAPGNREGVGTRAAGDARAHGPTDPPPG